MGRLLVGLLLSQGLFHAANQLLHGVLLAAHGPDEFPTVWASAPVGLLVEAFRFVALGAGCALAASTQRHGPLLGGVVGVWNGFLAVLLVSHTAPSLSAAALYAQPIVQGVLGVLAGLAGRAFWRPPTAEEGCVLVQPARKAVARPRRPLLAGPVSWFRVVLGTVAALAASRWASALFDKILDVSNGALTTTTYQQDHLFAWEVRGLLLIVAGALAGAGTRNGFKQGLCVAVALCTLLAGLDLPAARDPGALALNLLLSFALTVAGGWFGAQLFPPILRFRRKSCMDD